MKLDQYRIRNYQAETECDYCGYPFYQGDHAYYVEDCMAVVCSNTCASKLVQLTEKGFTTP